MLARFHYLWLVVLIASVSACTFDPYADVTCSNDGATDGERVCRDGVWVGAGGDLDASNSANGDADIPNDASRDAGTGDAGTGDVGPDACTLVSEAELCDEAGANCGSIDVRDNCGDERTIECGTCTSPETCGGSGTDNVCGCEGSDDAALCSAEGAECGTIDVVDPACGGERAVICGTCTSPETCGGGGTDNVCGCVETEAEVCARIGSNCGDVEVTDRCGQARTVNCGTCTDPESCGGGGVANSCGCDSATICAQVSQQCGMLDTSSRCSNLNMVDCGGCGASGMCATGTCDCDDGYEYDSGMATCVDIDECAADLDDCDANASCSNEPGTFTCTCNAGFMGDGTTCTPILPTVGQSVATAATNTDPMVTPSMTAQTDSLYVAFVNLNTNSRTVQSVSAFGQNFTRRLTQCSGDSDQDLEVWTLLLTSAASDGPVTVDLSDGPYAASVAVFRIDNVRTASDPVVATSSLNTSPGNGCGGGSSETSFQGFVEPSAANSITLIGWSRPGTSMTFSPAWNLEETASSSGALSGRNTDMSVFSAPSQGAGTQIVADATFANAVQYIVADIEIVAP